MINNYDGALVMPKNYAVVNEEEMTYVDGGFSATTHWWGVSLYFSHKETQLLRVGQLAASKFKAIPLEGRLIIKLARKYIGNKDKGRGVKMKISWNGLNLGVYSR